MKINEKLLKNEKLSSLMYVLKSEIERLEMLRKSLVAGPESCVDKTLRWIIDRKLDQVKKDFKRINLIANELTEDLDNNIVMDLPQVITDSRVDLVEGTPCMVDAFEMEIIESINEIKLTFSKLRYQK
jgi:hypothetical protein